MANTAPTLVREFAKGPPNGETPSSQDSGPIVAGSITNFGTPQSGPTTVEKQLTAARTIIGQAAGKSVPPDPIEDIFTPPIETSLQK